MDTLLQDLRYAIRSLRKSPGFTATAVVTLALGIGANTAIFSLVDSLLLRTLPVNDPARLVLITDSAPAHVRVWSYPVWEQIRQRPELFERTGAWSFTRFNLASGGETQFVDGLWASGSLFDTLGVRALVGRTFSPADDRRGGGDEGPVALIGYRFWSQHFAGARDVVGRSLRIEGVPVTIVGVAPPRFFGPEIGRAFDIVLPIGCEPLVRGRDSFLDHSGITFLTIVARLRPDQTTDAAAAGLRRVQPQIRDATLGEIGRFDSRAAIDRYLKTPFVLAPGATGYSGARDLRGMYEQPLLTLMAIVMLLLLIASVNVANLFIARGIAMRHQLSVRLALGASRGRLVRQLLTECALLYGAGAVLGLGIAAWTSRLLVRQLSTPPADSVVLDLSTDGRVLAFTIAITVVTTLLFGTAPAFRASRVAPMAALKPQGHAIVAEGRNALTGWLMIGQVALSLVLVVGAGLFVRTLVSLAGRELGFDPSRVLLVNVDAHNATKDAAQRLALYERARDAVRLLPDAAEAALSLTTPVGSGQFTPPVDIDGVSDTQGPVWANLVSPGWFATYRIPLLAGRDLGDRDHAGTPRVVVVNEAFVRKFAGGENPIGRTMTLYPRTRLAMGPIQIVGVVGDAVYSSLRSSAPPTFYLPLAQFDYLTELGIRSINLSVRSRTESPAALTKSVTAAVGSVDPKLALTFRLLANQVRAAQTQERMTALLSSFFAALALLLAALGLYGVTSYSVGTRRTEIGIRMALGSSTGSAVRLILRRVAFLLSVGIAIGLVGSVWASRFVAALLYGVQPRDLSTLLGAIALLAAVGLLGAYLPARRAALVDPMVALRAE